MSTPRFTRVSSPHGEGYIQGEVHARRRWANVAIDLICADLVTTAAGERALTAIKDRFREPIKNPLPPSGGASYMHVERVPVEQADDVLAELMRVVFEPHNVQPRRAYRRAALAQA